ASWIMVGLGSAGLIARARGEDPLCGGDSGRSTVVTPHCRPGWAWLALPHRPSPHPQSPPEPPMPPRPPVPACVLLMAAPALADEKAPSLAAGVRGLVTRAPAGGVAMDGKLTEWAGAFCTPVHYNHARPDDRAAQFYYAWDDQAFYVGLRALDR